MKGQLLKTFCEYESFFRLSLLDRIEETLFGEADRAPNNRPAEGVDWIRRKEQTKTFTQNEIQTQIRKEAHFCSQGVGGPRNGLSLGSQYDTQFDFNFSQDKQFDLEFEINGDSYSLQELKYLFFELENFKREDSDEIEVEGCKVRVVSFNSYSKEGEIAETLRTFRPDRVVFIDRNQRVQTLLSQFLSMNAEKTFCGSRSVILVDRVVSDRQDMEPLFSLRHPASLTGPKSAFGRLKAEVRRIRNFLDFPQYFERSFQKLLKTNTSFKNLKRYSREIPKFRGGRRGLSVGAFVKVDSRELSSTVPFLLHMQGFQIQVSMMKEGDYQLTNGKVVGREG